MQTEEEAGIGEKLRWILMCILGNTNGIMSEKRFLQNKKAKSFLPE
jgi:hypothetical protein